MHANFLSFIKAILLPVVFLVAVSYFCLVNVPTGFCGKGFNYSVLEKIHGIASSSRENPSTKLDSASASSAVALFVALSRTEVAVLNVTPMRDIWHFLHCKTNNL